MTGAWRQAVENFKEYLPIASRWVIAYERPYHSRILNELVPHLGLSELVCLGEDSPARVAKLGRKHRNDPDWAFLEFAVCDGRITHNEIDYRRALMEYSAWSAERMRLCFDVTDANFAVLFSEAPRELARRCQNLRKRLSGCKSLTFTDSGSGASSLNLKCPRDKWQVYAGLTKDDYMLPTGEVAGEPKSIEGELAVDGWIVGTIPFGIKFGAIKSGDIRLSFHDGRITLVTGKRRALCRDFEMVLNRIPGLQYVAEVGFGQSKAVGRAARKHETACLWHERHFGLHLGLGATLANEDRRTSHHLDLILRRGKVMNERGVEVIKW
jgi:leucyl aminopeptidase (aminopeptidase T)